MSLDQRIDEFDFENDQNKSEYSQQIECDTKIEFLNTKFYFHDLIKSSKTTFHYIVEDMEYDMQFQEDDDSPSFFYLKQIKFNSYEKYQYSKSYYQQILNYCQGRFPKKDIVLLQMLYNFEDFKNNYFELVVIFEYGETDRIDVENIEKHHIYQFLKNLCMLLDDMKDKANISHRNVHIKNIILVKNELKISGFKPLYTPLNGRLNWKQQMAKKYGFYRYDLYLVGLLWLKFLNVDLTKLVKKDYSMEQIIENVNKKLSSFKKGQNPPMMEKLLDLANYNHLTLEDVILSFNENLILENIEDDKGGNGNQDMQRRNSMESNLFKKSLKDSEADLHNVQQRIGKRINSFKTLNNEQAFKNQNNVIQFTGVDFTLKDDSRMSDEEKKELDELITIRDINEGKSNDFIGQDIVQQINGYKFNQKVIENRRSVDPNIDNVEKFIQNRVNSERQLISNVPKPHDNPFVKIQKMTQEPNPNSLRNIEDILQKKTIQNDELDSVDNNDQKDQEELERKNKKRAREKSLSGREIEEIKEMKEESQSADSEQQQDNVNIFKNDDEQSQKDSDDQIDHFLQSKFENQNYHEEEQVNLFQRKGTDQSENIPTQDQEYSEVRLDISQENNEEQNNVQNISFEQQNSSEQDQSLNFQIENKSQKTQKQQQVSSQKKKNDEKKTKSKSPNKSSTKKAKQKSQGSNNYLQKFQKGQEDSKKQSNIENKKNSTQNKKRKVFQKDIMEKINNQQTKQKQSKKRLDKKETNDIKQNQDKKENEKDLTADDELMRLLEKAKKKQLDNKKVTKKTEEKNIPQEPSNAEIQQIKQENLLLKKEIEDLQKKQHEFMQPQKPQKDSQKLSKKQLETKKEQQQSKHRLQEESDEEQYKKYEKRGTDYLEEELQKDLQKMQQKSMQIDNDIVTPFSKFEKMKFEDVTIPHREISSNLQKLPSKKDNVKISSSKKNLSHMKSSSVDKQHEETEHYRTETVSSSVRKQPMQSKRDSFRIFDKASDFLEQAEKPKPPKQKKKKEQKVERKKTPNYLKNYQSTRNSAKHSFYDTKQKYLNQGNTKRPTTFDEQNYGNKVQSTQHLQYNSTPKSTIKSNKLQKKLDKKNQKNIPEQSNYTHIEKTKKSENVTNQMNAKSLNQTPVKKQDLFKTKEIYKSSKAPQKLQKNPIANLDHQIKQNENLPLELQFQAQLQLFSQKNLPMQSEQVQQKNPQYNIGNQQGKTISRINSGQDLEQEQKQESNKQNKTLINIIENIEEPQSGRQTRKNSQQAEFKKVQKMQYNPEDNDDAEPDFISNKKNLQSDHNLFLPEKPAKSKKKLRRFKKKDPKGSYRNQFLSKRELQKSQNSISDIDQLTKSQLDIKPVKKNSTPNKSFRKKNSIKNRKKSFYGRQEEPVLEEETYEMKQQRLMACIEHKNIDEAILVLNEIISTEKHQRKLDAIILKSNFLQKQGNPNEAMELLQYGIRYIDKVGEMMHYQQKISILIKLSKIAMEQNYHEMALTFLKNDILLKEANQPLNYYTMVGDCYCKMVENEQAIENYKQQILRLLTKKATSDNMALIYVHVNKAVSCIADLNNIQVLRSFLEFVQKAIDIFKEENTPVQQNLLVEFQENIYFSIVNILYLKKKELFLELALFKIFYEFRMKCDRLNQDQIKKMFQIVLKVTMKLKKKASTEQEKKIYWDSLVWSENLNNKLEDDIEKVKKKLMILFNQGIFLVQKKDYDKSKATFDQILKLYSTHYAKPEDELFEILFTIGKNIYNQEHYYHSVYFLEKIVLLNCENLNIKNFTVKLLSTSYFIIGEFKKSHDLLEKYLPQFLNQEDNLEKYNCLYLLTIFQLCCLKIHSGKIKDALEVMYQHMDQNFELQHYFLIFYKLGHVYYKKKNLKQNQDYLVEFKQMVKGIELKGFSTKFINKLNRFYCIYVLDEQKKQQKNEAIFCLRDVNLTCEQNATKVENYLVYFFMNFYGFLKIITGAKFDEPQRQKLITNCQKLITEKNLYNKIYKILKKNLSQQTDHKHKLQGFKDLKFSQRSIPQYNQDNKKFQSQHTIQNNLQKEKPQAINWKNIKRVNSKKLIQNLKEKACVCEQFNQENRKLTIIMEEFFKKVQFLIQRGEYHFLDEMVVYLKKQIQQENLQLLKFQYIFKIVKFYTQNREINFFNFKKFSQMLESIIETGELCFHDYHRICILLETFDDPRYFENFFKHFEKYHQNMFKDILDKLLIEDFFKTSYLMWEVKCHNTIFKQKRFQILNFPLLEFFNYGDMVKHLQPIILNQFYPDCKFKILKQKSFITFLEKHLSQTVLSSIFFKQLFLENLLNFDNGYTTKLEMMKVLSDKMFEYILNDKSNGDIDLVMVFYDFYFFLNIVGFDDIDDSFCNKVVQILFFFEERLNQNDVFHFSLICSWIGNMFFAQKKYEVSNKCKSISFEALKKVQQIKEVEFPDYVPDFTMDDLFFSIFSYFFVIQMYLNNPNLAYKCLQKLMNSKQSESIKLASIKMMEFFYMSRINMKKDAKLLLLEYKVEDIITDDEYQVAFFNRVKASLLNECLGDQIVDEQLTKKNCVWIMEQM